MAVTCRSDKYNSHIYQQLLVRARVYAEAEVLLTHKVAVHLASFEKLRISSVTRQVRENRNMQMQMQKPALDRSSNDVICQTGRQAECDDRPV